MAPPRVLARSLRCALASLGVLSLLVACSATPRPTLEPLCTPGAYVFCRCQDRQQGTKLCKEDGQSFGPCEPCQTADNPEGPLDPDDPRDPITPIPDAGGDEPKPDPDAVCGDGVVQQGEDCDDENDDELDGCDSDCKLAGSKPAATNACPGLEVHVWGDAHAPSMVVQTSGSGNRSADPTCTKGNPTSGAAAPDRVFKVIPHKSGTLTVVAMTETFDSLLYVSETCAPTGDLQSVSWLECANQAGPKGNEMLSFPVTAGKEYFVFVDGYGIDANNQGTARVTFSLP